jgi:hypothetical protein
MRDIPKSFKWNSSSELHWALCVSLQLGAIEAQWFGLQPELAAQDQGDSPTLTVVGCHWGPVILSSARIGSPWPGRFPYSHCGWVPLRPSDSDFSQNWQPMTGEIPLLSLWLGAIEAQWFRLQPELAAQDRGYSPILQMIARGLLGAWITGSPYTRVSYSGGGFTPSMNLTWGGGIPHQFEFWNFFSGFENLIINLTNFK